VSARRPPEGSQGLPEGVKPSVARWERRKLKREAVRRAWREWLDYQRLRSTQEDWTPLAVPYQHGWRKRLAWAPREVVDDQPNVGDHHYRIFALVCTSVWCRDRRFVRRVTRQERRQRRVGDVRVDLVPKRLTHGDYAGLPLSLQQHFRPLRIKPRGEPVKTVWEVTRGWLQAWTTEVVEPCVVTHVRLPSSEREEMDVLYHRHFYDEGRWRLVFPDGDRGGSDWDLRSQGQREAMLDREAQDFVDAYRGLDKPPDA
jgi:hypothetical protein